MRRQVELPALYKGRALRAAYRLDLVVSTCVIVEVKSVETVLGVHKAQLLTYMKLANLRAGLLLNFHVPVLKEGITRLSL